MSDDGYCHDCEDVRYCGTIGKCLLGKRAVVGVSASGATCSKCHGTGANPDFPLANCSCWPHGVSAREEVSDERLARLHSEAMARANAPSPGQQWKCGDVDGVQGRVEALGAEIDQKLSKYDEPQTFSPELGAAADAALARLAGNAGVAAAPYQVVAPSDAGGGKDTP